MLVMKTWLTGGISDQNSAGDLIPVGYSFHQATLIKKVEAFAYSFWIL